MCIHPPCRKPARDQPPIFMALKDTGSEFAPSIQRRRAVSDASRQPSVREKEAGINDQDENRGEVRLRDQTTEHFAGLPDVDGARTHLVFAIGARAVARGDKGPAVRAHAAVIHAASFPFITAGGSAPRPYSRTKSSGASFHRSVRRAANTNPSSNFAISQSGINPVQPPEHHAFGIGRRQIVHSAADIGDRRQQERNAAPRPTRSSPGTAPAKASAGGRQRAAAEEARPPMATSTRSQFRKIQVFSSRRVTAQQQAFLVAPDLVQFGRRGDTAGRLQKRIDGVEIFGDGDIRQDAAAEPCSHQKRRQPAKLDHVAIVADSVLWGRQSCAAAFQAAHYKKAKPPERSAAAGIGHPTTPFPVG